MTLHGAVEHRPDHDDVRAAPGDEEARAGREGIQGLSRAMKSPTRGSQSYTYIHTYIHTKTLDNAHNSQAQGSNLRRRRSLGGKRTVDINDVQTDGFLDEIWMS